MLLKFLNYKDKAILLRKAREMGNISHSGVKISMYPDFSPDLQKRRAELMELKHRLQKFYVTYALLYSAQLQVVALGGTQFFDSPASVIAWLEDKKDQLLIK